MTPDDGLRVSPEGRDPEVIENKTPSPMIEGESENDWPRASV